MDLARAITVQFDIVSGIYIFIGIILMGVVVIFGSMYLYTEYQEYRRNKATKKDWL